MNKIDLVDIFNSAINGNYKYIAVKVQVKNSAYPEIIINSNRNFRDKMNYYVKAYDDNLCLNTCKDIKIIDIRKINSFSELDN